MSSLLALLFMVVGSPLASADVPNGNYDFTEHAPARRKVDGENRFFKSCGAARQLKDFASAILVRFDGKSVSVNSEEWIVKNTPFMGVAHQHGDDVKERFEISFYRDHDKAQGFVHFTRLTNGRRTCADTLFVGGTFTKL